LGDKELHFFHVLGDLALGFAALSEITASKAMGIFGLSNRQTLLGFFKLLNDGFHLSGCWVPFGGVSQ